MENTRRGFVSNRFCTDSFEVRFGRFRFTHRTRGRFGFGGRSVSTRRIDWRHGRFLVCRTVVVVRVAQSASGVAFRNDRKQIDCDRRDCFSRVRLAGSTIPGDGSDFLVFSIGLYGFYAEEVSPQNWAQRTFNLFLTAYKFFVFPLCFLIFADASVGRRIERLKEIFLMLPFWSVATVTPVTFGSDRKRFEEVLQNPFDVDHLRAASRLAIYMLLTLGGLVLVHFLVLGSPEFTHFNSKFQNPFTDHLNIPTLDRGFSSAAADSDSVVSRWAAVVLTFVLAYAHLTIFMNSIVICARLAGIPMPSNFNQPWKAKSFGEFYGRILYYYGRILTQIFQPVFKYTTQSIRNRLLRARLALFLALFVGGFYLHFIRDFKKVFRESFLETFLYYLPTAFYFGTIAFVIVATSGFLKFARWRIPQSIRVIAQLIVWSLVYSIYMATFHVRTDIETYSNYMRGLIP